MYALLDHAEPVVADDTEATIAKEAAERLESVARARQDIRVFVRNGAEIVVPLPARAVVLIHRLLEAMGERVPISVIPHEAEMTTQQAADFLNVSRPFLVRLLDEQKIAHRLVGRHRRIRFGDLLAFEKASRVERESALAEMAQQARDLGLD